MTAITKMTAEQARKEPVAKIMQAVANAYRVEPLHMLALAKLQHQIASELIRKGNEAQIPYEILAGAVMYVALCMASAHTAVPGIHWRLMKMMREAAPHMAAERERLSGERISK